MREASVFVHRIKSGTLREIEPRKKFEFEYAENYHGQPVSLTMPLKQKRFLFDTFPPFFDGLLPEGIQLDALLRQNKIDRNDLFSQLLAVGKDVVGAVTVEEHIQ